MAVKWRLLDGEGRPQIRAKGFYERLTRVTPAVKRRVNASNEKSAEALVAMMVRLVPRDEGDLERSIKYYEVTGTVGGGITWRVAAGDETAFYARLIEFGTPTMAAQPFFFPTYRSLRRLIRGRQRRAFAQGVKDSKA